MSPRGKCLECICHRREKSRGEKSLGEKVSGEIILCVNATEGGGEIVWRVNEAICRLTSSLRNCLGRLTTPIKILLVTQTFV